MTEPPARVPEEGRSPVSKGPEARQRASRRVATLALAVYSVLLAIALFSPSNHTQSHMLVWLMRPLSYVGVPFSLGTFNRLEVLMNAAIIAPLTFLGSIVWPRVRWQDWTAYAFLGAGFVEAFQGLFLPHREASFSDIVANTFGALVGALLAVAVVRVAASRATGLDG